MPFIQCCGLVDIYIFDDELEVNLCANNQIIIQR